NGLAQPVGTEAARIEASVRRCRAGIDERLRSQRSREVGNGDRACGIDGEIVAQALRAVVGEGCGAMKEDIGAVFSPPSAFSAVKIKDDVVLLGSPHRQ